MYKIGKYDYMDSIKLEAKLQELTDNLSEQDFIFDLLLAYGMPKANVNRLRKKSDVNRLDSEGELRVKNKKLFFKVMDNPDEVDLVELVESYKGIRFAIATDYKRFCAYDAELKTTIKIDLDNLSKNYDFFFPLAGIEKALFYDEKEADVKASIKMAKLFDELKRINPTTNDEEVKALNVFLTRLLFCFFAEDSNMFGEQENLFTNYIETVSKKDGSDLHFHIETIFNKLKIDSKDVAQNLKDFPYVNGDLFKKDYSIPTFTPKARKLLIESGAELNWSQINPDIFGSMIQAVVTEEHRGDMGMHYTSVPNIMKVIEPLFLDELHGEFNQIIEEYEPRIFALEEEQKSLSGTTSEEIKRAKSIKLSLGSLRSNFREKLSSLHNRLMKIKIFDPACGSGNFLIIAYKELRRLEMKILLAKKETAWESEIKLSSFYGIELDDFAHEVAILSLWLTEHQMNLEFSKIFGACNASLPLKGGGQIVQGNATRLDWNEICPREEGDEIYILGNPPYLGTRNQEKEHKSDIDYVFEKFSKRRKLDYISIWFFLAGKYINKINSRYAFVSTNSICQGEQVPILWSLILEDTKEINFAYQSFNWKNNAKGNAGITVVIVCIANKSKKTKSLYIDNHLHKVDTINPYLLPAPTIYIQSKTKPISKLPEMVRGNYTGCCSALILTENEKDILINDNNKSEKFIKKLVGSSELIKSENRYCLWIEDSQLKEALLIESIKNRIEKVEEERKNSSDKGQQRLVDRAHQFREFNQTKNNSIVIPVVSSMRREYIPSAFVSNSEIVPNSAQIIYDCEYWVFGVINSKIHMKWVDTLAGRLRSDYRYSSSICYNTFPFPNITIKQKDKISVLVENILDAREKEHPKTLAELYDPDKMPDYLRQAHKNLDLYIEQCYRVKPFESDEERLAYLFKLYEKMIKKENEA